MLASCSGRRRAVEIQSSMISPDPIPRSPMMRRVVCNSMNSPLRRCFFSQQIRGGTDNKNQEFYFKVITTRKRTSTTIRQLINILSHAEGTIIEPGLRMVEWYKIRPDAGIMDRLSSVRITASTSPPTTPKISEPSPETQKH